MKKSLSLILAIAMVFSMFASVAMANTAELTAQQKFDALKAKGIFAGYTDGTPGLDKNMTRAEFAKVIVLLNGLSEDKASNSFTDVGADHWAAGYIGAAAKAGFINGVGGGKFDAEGQVTIEQMATIFARALNLKVDANATVAGATDWAQGFVKAAIDAGLIASASNYAVAAKRELLVSASFTAEPKLAPKPAKLEVVDVKQTGMKKVAVTFNGKVEKQEDVKLTRGSVAVAYTVALAADGRSATITTTDNLLEAEHTVTLGDSSKKFNAAKETIKKIEFVNANDTVAMGTDIEIEFRALNQFDEATSLSAGAFNLYPTDRGSVKKTNNRLYANIAVGGTGNQFTTYNDPQNATISVNIVHTDSGVQTTQLLKVGMNQAVAKVELGDLKFTGNKTAMTKDVTAFIPFKAYDQYGARVTKASVLATNSNTGIFVNVIPDDGTIAAPTLEDVDGDGELDIKIQGVKLVDRDTDFTVMTYGKFGGQTVTKTVKYLATKTAASVEFGTAPNLGEGDVNKYLPFTVKDAQGTVLSYDEVLTALTDNKINIYATGMIELHADKMVRSGEHKGKIHISKASNKGSAQVYVTINSNGKSFTQNLSVGDHREPNAFSQVTNPAGKLIRSVHANNNDASTLDNITFTTFKLRVRDQFNENFNFNFYDSNAKTLSQGAYVALNKNEKYEVKTTITRREGDIDAIIIKSGGVDGAAGNILAFTADTVAGSVYNIRNVSQYDNVDFRIIADNVKTGKVTIKVELLKTTNGKSSPDVMASWSRNIDVISGTESSENITYSVDAIGTIYASKDVIDATNPKYGTDLRTLVSVTNAVYDSKLGKEVKISGKDSAGTVVALPRYSVITMTSSNQAVAVGNVPNNAAASKIYGIEEGTANISVAFWTPKGNVVATQEVKTSKEVPYVASIASDKAAGTISSNRLLGVNATPVTTNMTPWQNVSGTEFLMNKLTVKDQYGAEYVNEASSGKTEIQQYNALLGVMYSISNVKWVDENKMGTISINPTTGEISYALGADNTKVSSFTLSATASNGKSVSIDVKVD